MFSVLETLILQPLSPAWLARNFGVIAITLTLTALAASPAMAHRTKTWHRWHSAHTVTVDAPFARIATRRHTATAVDAPFTAVRSDRRGVWVRAPFVNLYVPRR